MKRIFSNTFRIFGVIRDVNNFFFIKRTCKKESIDSPIWSRNNLRIDWIGRIYTVINLPPEVTESKDLPKEYWPAYMIDQTKGLNEYLTQLNLSEIIIPEYQLLDGTTSYLLVYKPYFRDLSWWWIFSRIFIWTAIFIAEHKTHILSNGIHFLISLF
jgi:hypothetical protein